MCDNAELIRRLGLGCNGSNKRDPSYSPSSSHELSTSSQKDNVVGNGKPIIMKRMVERSNEDSSNSYSQNQKADKDNKRMKKREKKNKNDDKGHKFLTNVKILSKEVSDGQPPTPKKQNIPLRIATTKRKISKHSTVLINDALDFNIQVKDLLSEVSNDYHVISVIGEQGSGKSTIANLLSGLSTFDIYKKFIFKLSYFDTGLTRPSAPRVEIYVTKGDLIILDFKGIVKEKYLKCIVSRGKDYIGKDDGGKDEDWLRTEQLKLISYAISISHTMIVATNTLDGGNGFLEQLKLGNRINLGLTESMKTNNPTRFGSLAVGRIVNVLFFHSNRHGDDEKLIREQFNLKEKILDIGMEMSNLNVEAHFQVNNKYSQKYSLFVLPKILPSEYILKSKESSEIIQLGKPKPPLLLIDRRTTRKLNFITGESNFLYDDQENIATVPVKEYNYTYFPTHLLKFEGRFSEVFDEDLFTEIGSIEPECFEQKWKHIESIKLPSTDDIFNKFIAKNNPSSKGTNKNKNSVRFLNKYVDNTITSVRVGLKRLDKSCYFDKKVLTPKEWLMYSQNMWKNLMNLQLKTEKDDC
uniref:G domain-containing protein n=1 Tax=Parastrongyloides trichosuri TaxID=131310 RepID=A0A0N4Z461_PARTI